MVSAVLSDAEVRNQTLRSQRNFGLSFATAVAVHLLVFIVFIDFSFNADSPQLMMPATQVIKASLVMSVAPKPIVKPQPVKPHESVKKQKPARVVKQKPLPKNIARTMPKPEPRPVLETIQTAVETQPPPVTIVAVDEKIAADLPHQVAIAEEIYVPPSSNVAYHHNPKPYYPSAAKRRGMEGVVELWVMVDSHGQPVGIEVKKSSGFRVLDREAIKAVWQWRFQPAKRAGIAIAGEVVVPVRYLLD